MATANPPTPEGRGQLLITGGTRGIGAGLVRAFASAGWTVGFTGRTRESVEAAMEALARLPGEWHHRAWGWPCRVEQADQVEAWAAEAFRRGPVAAVICNAGASAPSRKVTELEPETMRTVLDANLTGPFLCARSFIPRLEGQGQGSFWLMEGLGSRGEWQPGLTLYGAGKYGAEYLARALHRECRDGPVGIGLLSPGMVVTDLLLADQGGLQGIAAMPEKRRRIYNILADRVETVAPWLAGRVMSTLALPRFPRGKNPVRHAWLTTGKVFTRFLTAGFLPRNVFDPPSGTAGNQ